MKNCGVADATFPCGGSVISLRRVSDFPSGGQRFPFGRSAISLREVSDFPSGGEWVVAREMKNEE